MAWVPPFVWHDLPVEDTPIASSQLIAYTSSLASYVDTQIALCAKLSTSLTGDLGGTLASPKVLKLNGIKVNGAPIKVGEGIISTSTTEAAWGELATGTVGTTASDLAFNPKDAPYNAQFDNASDDTKAIQEAHDAAAVAGGWLFIPAGIGLTKGLIWNTKVHIRGPGTLKLYPHTKLKVGEEGDVIVSKEFKTLAAPAVGGVGNGKSTGGVHECSIEGPIIDGNVANNGGAGEGGCGIRVYGYDYRIGNVNIKNCRERPLISEWGEGTINNNSSVEAVISNVKGNNCANGIYFNGPYSSTMYAVKAFGNAVNSVGFEIGEKAAGLKLIDPLVWAYGESEKVAVGARIRGKNTQVIGGRFEGHVNGGVGIAILANGVMLNKPTVATGLKNGGFTTDSNATGKGIQLGSTSESITVEDCNIDTTVYNCTEAPIVFEKYKNNTIKVRTDNTGSTPYSPPSSLDNTNSFDLKNTCKGAALKNTVYYPVANNTENTGAQAKVATKAGIFSDSDFKVTPEDGMLALNTTAGSLEYRTGGAYKKLITKAEVEALIGTTQTSVNGPQVATFGQEGPLTVFESQEKYLFPFEASITNVLATVGTAPTGSSLIVDVKKNGSTIFTTTANRPTIAASQFVSLAAVPNIISLAAGDYLTVGVTQIGSTTAGSDLVVQIQYRPTVGSGTAPSETGGELKQADVLESLNETAQGERELSQRKHRVAYEDAAVFTDQFSNLTSWTLGAAGSLTVTGNQVYGTVTSTEADVAAASFTVGATEPFRLVGQVNVRATTTGSSGRMVGIGVSSAIASEPKNFNAWSVIGFDCATRKALTFTRSGVSETLSSTGGASEMSNGLWLITIVGDENWVSFTMVKSDRSEEYKEMFKRSTIGAIKSIIIAVQDGRGSPTGSSVGPIGIRASEATISPRTNIEGIGHRPIWTTDESKTNTIRIELPSTFDSRVPPPAWIFFCHGALETENSTISDSTKRETFKKLLDNGFPIAASNMHGDSYGNNQSQTDLLALYRYVRDHYPLAPIIILGFSAGGNATGVALHRRELPGIIGWIGVSPGLNLKYFKEHHLESQYSAFIAGFRTAYGIASDDSNWDAQVAGLDPMEYPANDYRGIPALLCASTEDTTVVKTANADLMFAKLNGYARFIQELTTSGNHSTAGNWNPTEIVNFAKKIAKT